MKRVFMVSAVILFMTGLTAPLFVHNILYSESNESEPFYFGVSFCGDTTAEAKLFIDRVKDYNNLFVLQSGPVSKNETATNEICDYAVAAGLKIIVYFGWFDPDCPWQVPWLDFAKQRWGDRFLGIYYYDEPGGIQIDYNWSNMFTRMQQRNTTLYQSLASVIETYLAGTLPRDYDEAANRFIGAIQNDPDIKELKNRSITAFTSDYALYWFDYLGGYDVLLAQFGWNHTLEQDIALIRGAANLQNKSWGTIITWKYDHPPYLDTAENIYNQMRTSYEAGAEYIIIFNYPTHPEGNQYGTMINDHFDALERFWKDAVKNPQVIHGSTKAEAALVLPRNYGCGMRHPDDRIWYWVPDKDSSQIWELSRTLLDQYGLRLDIVYDDPAFPVEGKYEQIYYWNQTK